MRHNHEVSNKIAPYYAINRRITKHELKQVADVIAVMPSSRALQYFLKERFRRPMTLQDAKNTRARLKTMQLKQAHTESIRVVPSIKAIPQIHNESDGRTVLEIKEEVADDNDSFEDDGKQVTQQEEKCELAMKSKALSEIVTTFSELMNSCDTSVFWERVAVMSKVMECWENGENLDIHYTSEYNNDNLDLGSSKSDINCMQGRTQQYMRIPQDTPNESNCNSSVAQQGVANQQMKVLLPILSGTMHFVPASIHASSASSVKLMLPQDETKPVSKSDNVVKRPRGRPRKKDSTSSQVIPKKKLTEYITYQNKSRSSDMGHVKNGSDSKENESRRSVNNLNDSSDFDFYSGMPFISCITKEPGLDITDQALEVEIEINDDDIP